ELKTGAEVTHASFSPDGTRIVTASKDHNARIWDAATYEPLWTLNQKGAITGTAFSPDGKLVLTSGSNETVKLWDAASGKVLGALRPKKAVRQATFNVDGTRILARTSDGVVREYDVQNPRKPGLLFTLPAEKVNDARFSPDGRLIATVDRAGRAQLW